MSSLVKFAAGAIAALAISGGAAQASTWVIDYTANNPTDTPQSAVINLVASDVLNAVNGYDVLSIGVGSSVDGDTIAVTGLVNNPNQPNVSTSTDGLFFFDNVVWPGAAQQLSNPGILFVGQSGTEYNLFSDDAVHYELYTAVNGAWGAHSYGTIAMAETFSRDQTSVTGGVPEPASWALMILGFGAVGAVLRRRRQEAFTAA